MPDSESFFSKLLAWAAEERVNSDAATTATAERSNHGQNAPE